MSHTFKTWTYIANGDANSFSIKTDGRWIVYLLNGEMLPAQQEGIMRRICACMNACAQITTDELENIAATGGMLGPREDVASIAQERDELLAALKDARELVDGWGAYASNYMQEKHDLAGDIKRLSAAITKVEARKP